MIVCISPNFVYLEESINTLNYARKAKKIKQSTQSKVSQLQYRSVTETNQKLKIDELEREMKYLKGVLKAKQDTNIKPSYDSAQEYDSLPSGEEEFSELLEALLENVEDLNLIRQNIVELDELLKQNDEALSKLQAEIELKEDYEGNQLLYKELKILANKLEENLELKENAVLESQQLSRTIKCTKVALKKMFSSREVLPVGDTQPQQVPQQSTRRDLADDYMLSSTREATFLMEELKRKDKEIDSLRTALRNVSKASATLLPSKQSQAPLASEEDKENKPVNKPLQGQPYFKTEKGDRILFDSSLEDMDFNKLVQRMKSSFKPFDDSNLKKAPDLDLCLLTPAIHMTEGSNPLDQTTNPMSIMDSNDPREVGEELAVDMERLLLRPSEVEPGLKSKAMQKVKDNQSHKVLRKIDSKVKLIK